MCRLLLVKTKQMIKPQRLLEAFADMAEQSRTADGDRQGDGWGVAWRVDNQWQRYTSLSSVWTDRKQFADIPEGSLFAVHARSASFADQIGVLEYNQPYITKDLCFVFNGVLKGVRLQRVLDGKIGAQKICSLVCQEIQKQSATETLNTVDALLRQHTQEIIGLNIGLIIDGTLHALCDYKDNKNYFGIHWYSDPTISMICSEPLPGYQWNQLAKGQVFSM